MELNFPNEQDSQAMFLIGTFVSVISFTLMFVLDYDTYFNRRDYYNKKYFYKWLKNNKLPKYSKKYGKKWIIGIYEVTLYNNSWFVHDNIGNTIICSFNGGIRSKRLYNKILKILENE